MKQSYLHKDSNLSRKAYTFGTLNSHQMLKSHCHAGNKLESMPPPERLPGCLAKGNASRPVENRSSDSTNMMLATLLRLASSFEKKSASLASPPHKSTPGGTVNPEANNSTAGPHFTRALVAKQRQRHLAWGSPWFYYPQEIKLCHLTADTQNETVHENTS